MWRIDPLQFLVALGLDLALGDPQHWPHIARATGSLSMFWEKICSRFLGRTVFSGTVFWFCVCATLLGTYALVHTLLMRWFPAGAWWLGVGVVYQSVAARDLDRHARAVLGPLLVADLPEARRRLSHIVGRDTAELNDSEISRAAVEAVAESTTDGVIAPIFWAVVGGPAGALLYRTVNTLDSMVGHRTERYELIGKWAARADDVFSFIPARLCALVSVGTHGLRHVARVAREARQHASPNAGWSESAAAWALDIRLGGTNYYDGVPHRGPVFNPEGTRPGAFDILRILRWFWIVTACTSIFFAAFLEWRRIRERPEAPPLFPKYSLSHGTSS